jgi:hypothetical protein
LEVLSDNPNKVGESVRGGVCGADSEMEYDEDVEELAE